MAANTTDPGSRSAAEIEREVDAERAKVSRTIDALQDKMSVGSVMDQFVQVMGTHGGDVARNLGRQVRDNPLPLLLTGIGLAWLMAGGGPRRDDDDDYLNDEDLRASGRYRRTAYPSSGYPYPATVGTPESYASRPSAESVHRSSGDPLRPHTYAAGGRDHGQGGMGDTMKGAASSVGDTVKGAASSVGDTVRGAAGSVGETLGDAASRVRDTAGGVTEAAGDFGRRVSGAVGDTAEALSDTAWEQAESARRAAAGLGRSAARRGRDAQESIARLMDEQPLVFGALALAVGAAIGGALPRSRTEDDLFGAESDRLKGAATSMAKEEGRRLQATAAGVMDEAEKIADEAAAAIGEKAGDARSLVDKAEARLGDAAERLADRAKEEADRQKLGQPAASGKPTSPGQPAASGKPTSPGQPAASDRTTFPDRPASSARPTSPDRK